MTVKFSPWGNQQFFDENGDPAVGWKIYTYAAGSSATQATYTSSAGDVPQTNPIVLNALGLPANEQIWLTSGLSYKLVLTDENDVEKHTEDNISGVNDASIDISQWLSSGVTPTYVSANSFTVAGDQTTEFHVGRREQFTVTAGAVYGAIASSAYDGSSLTTVTMTMDGASVLDSGLSAVNHSILRADNPAIPVADIALSGLEMSGAINEARATVASHATTADIWSAAGNSINWTGTATTTDFPAAPQAGARRRLHCAGACSFTHSATLDILGNVNFTAVAGDIVDVEAITTTTFRLIPIKSGSQTVVNTNTTLSASSSDDSIVSTAAGAIAVTLPSVAAVPSRTRRLFWNYGTGVMTVTRAGTDQIYMNGANAVTSVALAQGDSLLLESQGTLWYAVGGSAQLKYSGAFASSLGASGYEKLPSGKIRQWGTVSATGGTSTVVTYPIGFPNGTKNVQLTPRISSGNYYEFGTNTENAGNFQIWNPNATTNVYWESIGD